MDMNKSVINCSYIDVRDSKTSKIKPNCPNNRDLISEGRLLKHQMDAAVRSLSMCWGCISYLLTSSLAQVEGRGLSWLWDPQGLVSGFYHSNAWKQILDLSNRLENRMFVGFKHASDCLSFFQW